MKIDQASLKVGDRVKYSAHSICNRIRSMEGWTPWATIKAQREHLKGIRGTIKEVHSTGFVVAWDTEPESSCLAYVIERA